MNLLDALIPQQSRYLSHHYLDNTPTDSPPGNPLAAADSELMRKGIDKPLEKFLAKVQSSPGNWPKKCPVGYSQHLAIEVAVSDRKNLFSRSA